MCPFVTRGTTDELETGIVPVSSILVACVRVSRAAKYAWKRPKKRPWTSPDADVQTGLLPLTIAGGFRVSSVPPGICGTTSPRSPPQRRRGVSRCGLREDEAGETLRGTREIFIDHVPCHAMQAVDAGAHVGRIDAHQHAKVSGPSDDARSLGEVFCRMTWSTGLTVNRPTRQVERIKVLVAAWVSPLGDQPPALEANHRSAHPRRFHVVAQPMV